MAEEKKTTSTRAKSTTAKSSTARTTAAKKTTTKKTTTKTTAPKATTATKETKAPASKLSAEERAKKEALRKEVLEHYTKQQNYRATTPSYMQPPVYEYEEEVNEIEEDFTPIPTSEQYFEERATTMPGSIYTRNTSSIAREPDGYEPEARAYTPRETLEPTSISTNPKITSLNSKKKDPYRREKVKDGIKSFFAQDGLFYFFGFIALIGVLVIMFT